MAGLIRFRIQKSLHKAMIQIRRSEERGHADHGWLDTYHTFSFARYFDPEHMGFRSLRVINEDVIAPGKGFGTHPHQDMEILTYVLEGALEHRDSMGSRSVIRPGRIQKMSAGSGVQHSEYNASDSEPVHLLQIWIEPQRLGIEPQYRERDIDLPQGSGLQLLAANNPSDGAIELHQDASVYVGRVEAGEELTHEVDPHCGIWLQMISGRLKVNAEDLETGDGAAITQESKLTLDAIETSNFLLFDLA